MHNLKPAMHVEGEKPGTLPLKIRFSFRYHTEKKLDFCIDRKTIPPQIAYKQLNPRQALAITALNIGFLKK